MIKKLKGKESRQKIMIDIQPQKPMLIVTFFFYLTLALWAGFTTEYQPFERHKL